MNKRLISLLVLTTIILVGYLSLSPSLVAKAEGVPTPTATAQVNVEGGQVKIKTSVGGVVPVETSFDLKSIFGQGTPIGYAIIIVVVVLVLTATAKMWHLNRQLRELKMRIGEKAVFKKSRLQIAYWWLAVILLVVFLWTKDEVIWLFTGISGQIWLILKIREYIGRFVRHINLDKHLPWFLDLGKEFVLILIVGSYASYTLAFAWGWVPAILAVEDSIVVKVPSFSEPKKWSGAPLANLPQGVVIPAIWDEIAAGVADEGGPTSVVPVLYSAQRTEFANKGNCTETDHLACTSSAGAQGWFQFMPGTWATYAEPGWSQYNLRDSSRAAYRMFKKLKLFEQTSRVSFQTRFTGEDGGLAWNMKTAKPDDYDGWGQAGIVWDNSQAIVAASAPKSETVLQANTVGEAVSISLSQVPPSQQRNVKVWAERNARVVVPANGQGSWSFCQATDNTGWDGYDYAGGISAGGICANSSMLYTWVQNTPGLSIGVATNHTYYEKWPVFTKAVNCPAMDFTIINTTNQEIIGEWSIDGDTVTLRQVTK